VAFLTLVVALAIAPLARQIAAGGPIDNLHRSASDEAAAGLILGQTLPTIQRPISGFARTELTASPVDPGTPIPRMVHQAFAVDGTNIALLTVFRGTFTPNNYDIAIEDRGALVGISVRTILDGSTDVAYVWSRHGLVYNLHINLSHGIDRPLADRIAASIP
jgi:hypothetical protein